MKYKIMNRRRMVSETNDIEIARRRLEKLGCYAYIEYSREAIEEYEASHEPLTGSDEACISPSQ